MSKYIGKEVIIKTKKANCIDTSGNSCVIVAWDKDIGKYEVDFRNGFHGWYKRSELIFDT